jgi:hypothetical protein
MPMTFDEMKEAVADAESTISAADSQVAAMAKLIRGRLRTGGVSYYTLGILKDELRRYNAHTKSWRD